MADTRPTRQDGSVIRRLRIERGLRQHELAERIDCHPKHLQHVERDERSASEVLMVRLAKALGVDTRDISKTEAAA